MSEQEPTPFNFWWPTSVTGDKVMSLALIVIGFLVLIGGCIYEELGYEVRSEYGNPGEAILMILFFYVAPAVVGWYFIINIGRFIYDRATRSSEPIRAMRETRREKAELKVLRRRSEIKKLKKELGEDDNDEDADTGCIDGSN